MLFQMGCTTTAVPIRNFGLAPPKPHFVAKGGGGGGTLHYAGSTKLPYKQMPKAH